MRPSMPAKISCAGSLALSDEKKCVAAATRSLSTPNVRLAPTSIVQRSARLASRRVSWKAKVAPTLVRATIRDHVAPAANVYTGITAPVGSGLSMVCEMLLKPTRPNSTPSCPNEPAGTRTVAMTPVAPSTQVNYLQPVTALGHTPLRLSELLTPDRIRVPIRAQSKEGVLRELVEFLVGGNGAAPDVLQAVMERERQFPTGIGYGVAVPHGKTPALANLIAVAGTARTPVPYETVDGEPVRLFFLLAGPESQAAAHVNALSTTAGGV